jgi:hypothetical protein
VRMSESAFSALGALFVLMNECRQESAAGLLQPSTTNRNVFPAGVWISAPGERHRVGLRSLTADFITASWTPYLRSMVWIVVVPRQFKPTATLP